MFGPGMKGRTDIVATDEGYAISKSLLLKGYVDDDELVAFPAADSSGGTHPVIECTQNIPCDPCQDVCPKGCILVGSNITMIPRVDKEKGCSGCALCVGSCPGQAIFLINEKYEEGYGTVGFPYEFLPLPEKGSQGKALDRSGSEICDAEIVDVKNNAAMNKTPMVVMKVPSSEVGRARFFKLEGGV
jgi:Fe-S-cluster-containing hydrogenase component 2